MFTQEVLFAFLIGFLLGSGLLYLYFYLKRIKTQEIADTLLSQANLHFEALSAEALRKNSDHFFQIASQTLTSQAALGGQDLENKKQLIDQTLEGMKKELEGVSTLVTQLEKDRETKFGELTQQIKATSEQTGKLQETTEHLRIALSNTRVRGQWGERMAEDVLRAAGFIEGINYLKQQTLRESRNRPDYSFLLPRGLQVHMDVKFPLDNYLKYLEAENEDSKITYCNRFMQDVKKRIKEVSMRDYTDPSESTISYMIVFIPNEQLFAFVCQQDPHMLDLALSSNVILCSPLTLFAILAVIRQAIDNFYLEEKTLKIFEVLASFQKQWSAFVNSFDDLGNKIEAVRSGYSNLTTTRRNQLDRQLMKIDELRQEQEELLRLDETNEDTGIEQSMGSN